LQLLQLLLSVALHSRDSITTTTDEVVTASKTLFAADDSPVAVISVALEECKRFSM
jgi:hypothetical protein